MAVQTTERTNKTLRKSQPSAWLSCLRRRSTAYARLGAKNKPQSPRSTKCEGDPQATQDGGWQSFQEESTVMACAICVSREVGAHIQHIYLN